MTQLGDVHLLDNARLTSLEGLHGVSEILVDLHVRGSPSLMSLAGLRSLEAIGRGDGSIELADLDALADLEGLGVAEA